MNRKIHFVRIIAILLVTAGISSSACDNAAEASGSGIVPSFCAVVVSNVDTAAAWYKSVLGLTDKETMNDPAGTYKVVILKSPAMELELLQLQGSLSRSSILAGKPAGTQIQGHFKVGFKLSDMDRFLAHLAELNVSVPQIWTDAATHKRNFLIRDPDGNTLQFFE